MLEHPRIQTLGQRLCIAGFGFAGFAQFLQQAAKVEIRLGQSGLRRDGAAVTRLRRVRALHQLQRRAQIVVRLGVARVQRQRGEIMPLRFSQLAPLLARVGELVTRFGVAWAQRERAPQRALRAGEVARIEQLHAGGETRRRGISFRHRLKPGALPAPPAMLRICPPGFMLLLCSAFD